MSQDLEFGGTMYRFAIPIISLAFLMLVAEQFLAVRGGQRPDWGRPFVRTTAFIVLLAAYAPLSSGIIGAVHMAGSIESSFTDITVGDGATSTSGVLAQRAKEFQKLRARIENEVKTEGTSDGFLPTSEDIALVAESVMTSVIDDLLYIVTWFTFTFAAFAIFAIKTLSGAITNILLEIGPMMIAFAAIPGLTSRYLTAWCMALIEVTAWGPIAAIILQLLARVNAQTAGVAVLEDANYAEHIVLNFVYAGLFLSVPAITHMILSGAAVSVGNTGMAAAMAGIAAAGRPAAAGARAAVQAGGSVVSAAAPVAAQAASQVAGRVGDSVNGNATLGTVTAASAGIASTMMSNSAAEARQQERAVHAKRGAIEKHRRGD